MTYKILFSYFPSFPWVIYGLEWSVSIKTNTYKKHSHSAVSNISRTRTNTKTIVSIVTSVKHWMFKRQFFVPFAHFINYIFVQESTEQPPKHTHTHSPSPQHSDQILSYGCKAVLSRDKTVALFGQPVPASPPPPQAESQGAGGQRNKMSVFSNELLPVSNS